MPLEIEQALDRLTELLIELKEEECQRLAQGLLANGTDHLLIKKTFRPALLEIGRLYESGLYFASSLILVGRVIRKIMEMIHDPLNPELFPGRALLGSLAEREREEKLQPPLAMTLAAFGYEVQDLGLETALETFLPEAKRFQPNLIGLHLGAPPNPSRLRRLIELLKEQGSPEQKLVICLSGPRAQENLRKKTGADYSLTTIAETMDMFHQLLMSYPF
ncbi:MAG: B12-binding domain-containing protein [Deltaproteobacteria bacterium]|jgi:methanogenic corrinoid protein MtbC1|nr:B12-binding domain-containing protein [Deltaproteobacteria bacterium]